MQSSSAVLHGIHTNEQGHRTGTNEACLAGAAQQAGCRTPQDSVYRAVGSDGSSPPPPSGKSAEVESGRCSLTMVVNRDDMTGMQHIARLPSCIARDGELQQQARAPRSHQGSDGVYTQTCLRAVYSLC